MQPIALPYHADTRHYLQALMSANGLIWYHQGLGQSKREWLAAWPTEEYQYWGEERIQVRFDDGHEVSRQGDWRAFLLARCPQLEGCSDLTFVGGLAGHFSYDLGLELHRLRSRHQPLEQPLATVGLYHWAINLDHEQQQAWLVIQQSCPARIRTKLKLLQQQLQQSGTLAGVKVSGRWQCPVNEARYRQAFKRIQHYLIAGDCYQINLTRQWSLPVPALNDLALYNHLSQNMPAPFSVFHRCCNHSLLSVSPERFIQIKDGIARTQPIKGTRRRGQNADEDRRLAQELLNSSKDRAENLMIVDLLRNDLARNARPGSVSVDKLFELQSFSNVHHLVSTIRAELKPTVHPLQILLDAFPGGSITGAPKKRAMEIIDELEWTRRGNYCGCSFYLTANDQLDSNILIRTVTLKDNQLTCSGGGGIVIDSQWQDEFRESDIKVRRILSALAQD